MCIRDRHNFLQCLTVDNLLAWYGLGGRNNITENEFHEVVPGLTYLLELPKSTKTVNCTKFMANVTAVKPDFYDKFIEKHGAVSEEHIGHLLHSINQTIGTHLTNTKVRLFYEA